MTTTPARQAVISALMWPNWNPTSESYGSGEEKANELIDAAIAEDRAAHAAEVRAAARAELEDQRAAKRTAAESADRFRDVVADCLGHADENPGDDALIAELRAHFGRTGPEPTGWRDRLVGYEAARDQINAAVRPDNTTGA